MKTSEGLDFARRGFFHGSGKRRDWIILAGTSVIIRFPGKRLFEPPTFVITYHAPGERSEYGEKWTEWISLDSNNNNNNNDLSMILGGRNFLGGEKFSTPGGRQKSLGWGRVGGGRG